MPKDIAIIGAGIAGLACAQRLQSGGHSVTLFDKGRGAGGRMATRRVTTPVGEIAFDHGAQYFNVRDPALLEAVIQWEADGVITRWPRAGIDARVGTPGMNAVVKAMAAPLDVHWNSTVEAIRRIDGVWFIDPVSAKAFDAVVLATPAEQAAPLLVAHDPNKIAL
jgi:renalase